ncbi:hypothetical protein IAQ61_003535 [Plenodomus lingam]|uniref:BZIP domain-containing protein n=1 Tax=Leptosphaeria maculans (strain JN3 / isolate v23.1.3 / race Av1-4-5-6-7-8) TaxID=985895 RepID=E4ZQX9_LEPMJ|nr:hypothetical protein LEMA_P033180.1 [Plenodomus lingam JN3]KAH9874346.1 hypothetical protein IAQ61_003535 [Plenodomus lingam]CBX93644.1 hypothetical protein LEMA_P033180.1 [Plenodomus lingam JN3]
MSDLGVSHKTQNLARIRDNQRRSRARRKEYLQELEAKLRSCEQAGIEASSKIQSAARRVLDENRKLRSLLYERGASEPEIVAALGGPPDQPYEQISATPILNAMLERRITTNELPSISYPAPSQTPMRAACLSGHRSSVQPISIPAARLNAVSRKDSQNPGSMISSTSTSPPSYSSAYYATSMTSSAAEVKTEDAYSYPFDQSYSNNWTLPSDYNLETDPVSSYSTSSCVDAANIIRTMRANAGPELEADLGCRAPGQHCYVNNNVVFSMMDKYSNQNASI